MAEVGKPQDLLIHWPPRVSLNHDIVHATSTEPASCDLQSASWATTSMSAMREDIASHQWITEGR